jgi:hypothetical protein
MKGGYLIGPPRDGYPAPYGGLALHCEHLGDCRRDFTSDPLASLYGFTVILADMPLTAVGDTVTLPWVLKDRDRHLPMTQPLPKGVVPAEMPP